MCEAEYHFDCPIDNTLFRFKGVKGAEVRPLLASGAGGDEIATFMDTHDTPKTAADLTVWVDSVEAISPCNDPETREWFTEECVRLGLEPGTLCASPDADDRASFVSRR